MITTMGEGTQEAREAVELSAAAGPRVATGDMWWKHWRAHFPVPRVCVSCDRSSCAGETQQAYALIQDFVVFWIPV